MYTLYTLMPSQNFFLFFVCFVLRFSANILFYFSLPEIILIVLVLVNSNNTASNFAFLLYSYMSFNLFEFCFLAIKFKLQFCILLLPCFKCRNWNIKVIFDLLLNGTQPWQILTDLKLCMFFLSF